MTEHFIREVLFPVLQSGMGLERAPVPLSEEDCRELARLGAQQDILPILLQGVKKQGVPCQWLEEQKQAQSMCLYRYVLLEDALKKIGAALDRAGIPWLPLKGAVIRSLYPEPWMRTSSDVDVLVHEEDLDRAVAALEAETSFRAKTRDYHDISLYSEHVLLELHFSILEGLDNIDPLLRRVWEYAVPTGEGCRHTMTPEFQMFHILAHMSYHLLHGGLGIRPFLDLWLLEKRAAFDPETLRGLCAECGLLPFYETGLHLTRVWLENAPHTQLSAALESCCLEGGVFDSGRLTGAVKQREKRGIRYFLSRLFVKRSFLEEMYPSLKKHPWLLPFCQIRRWFRLLDREKRRNARDEIAAAKTVRSEDIEAFDRMLSDLGFSK